MDTLTGLLEASGLRCTDMRACAMEPQWTVRRQSDNAVFYIVTQGTCHLKVASQPDVHLKSGDIALLAAAQSHVLSDAMDTRWVQGNIFSTAETGTSVLETLPPVSHGSAVGGAALWIESGLGWLGKEELTAPIVSHFATIALYLVLSSLFDPRAPYGKGTNADWLRAMVDPEVRKALDLMHRLPEKHWSVDSLADSVAMSRSAFASRFSELVGEPPLTYLTRWRMQRAGQLLRETDLSIEDVANKVGYQASTAFSKAFKRINAIGPGAYRAQANLGSDSSSRSALDHIDGVLLEDYFSRRALSSPTAAESVSKVLAKIALLAEHLVPSAICSILLLDQDGEHLRHGAGPSLPKAYNQAIDRIAIGPMVGSCGTAAYSRQTVVVPDLTTDARWTNYRNIAQRYDLRACWSQPIFGEKQSVLGTFTVYHRETHDPDPAEMAVIRDMTDLVRHALTQGGR